MYRTQQWTASESRRGLILLVVLFMLTLFAIAGLSLVLYADAEAQAARGHRDAANFFQPDMEPELAFSYFVSQLLFDCMDDETGVYSALRGHSLARNMYGLNAELIPPAPPSQVPRWELRGNYIPYNGPGRLHYPGAHGQDDYYLINYQRFRELDAGVQRHPERVFDPANPTARGPFVASNVAYTSPDYNNMFMAATRADGTVMVPSYFRPWGPFGPMGTRNGAQFVPNPNWTAGGPELRYMTLRPRPADHQGFPPPEDEGGDVKNWPWAPGGNDSIWIDIGAPVLKGPDGRKYKMLVAPLIVDLDSRINVNVAGNVHGGANFNYAHRSNQGWGPWEINLGRVLNVGDEWKNLFRGRPYTAPPAGVNWVGKYGPDQQVRLGASQALPLGNASPIVAHQYAPLDPDARIEPDPNLQAGTLPGDFTPPPVFPTSGGATISAFPAFPITGSGTGDGYGNGSLEERRNHPLLYNVFRGSTFSTTNDDRVFKPFNTQALYSGMDTNSEAMLNNDLLRLLPNNLRGTDLASLRRRNMLTPTSWYVDKAGAVPYVWDPANSGFRLDPAKGYPVGASIPFPNPTTPRPATPAGSEFSQASWQSLLAREGKINLDRPLDDYPAPDAATGQITNLAAYNNALRDRQVLARDLFERLQKVTGSADPNVVAVGSDEYNAVRYLAQLAVNIVDFIDTDDYMTLFTWRTGENVYGTEMPRLVLNEVYAQLDNLGTDTSPTPTGYNVNFWVELHNPLHTLPTLTDNGWAKLKIGNDPVYQLMLVDGPDPRMRAPDNPAGDPDPAKLKKTNVTWGPNNDTWAVLPCNGQFACQSQGPGGTKTDAFYVIGTETQFQAGADPKLGVHCAATSPDLTYQILANDQQIIDTPPRPTILLRRLLCPHLPPGPTNPYITVDVMEDVQVNDGRNFDTAGAVPAGVVAMTERKSWGKNQPSASHLSQRLAQNPMMPLRNQPKHTLLKHNAIDNNTPITPGGPPQTLKDPIEWLFHPDRQLISPAELLQVSGYKPHELLGKFYSPDPVTGAIISYGHLAPWTVPETRLSRLFGFLKVRSRVIQSSEYRFFDNLLTFGRVETTEDWRVAGKININNVWDEEILQALCDASAPGAGSNFFTPAEVSAAFRRLLEHRHRVASGAPLPLGPTGNDRPLLDLSTGFTAAGDTQFPNGISVGDTVLSPGLFYQAGSTAHPYHRFELLNKIFNNITVRSHVFAVWITVGFFEVVDDTKRPVVLGAEIGKAEGRHIRHRMFSIVDRSNLRFGVLTVVPRPGQQVGQPIPTPPSTPPVILTLNVNGGTTIQTPGGNTWTFEDGQPVTWDPGTTQEESNNLRQTTPASFGVITTKTHAIGSTMVVPGNVGAWPGFDQRRGNNIVFVPYWAIID